METTKTTNGNTTTESLMSRAELTDRIIELLGRAKLSDVLVVLSDACDVEADSAYDADNDDAAGRWQDVSEKVHAAADEAERIENGESARHVAYDANGRLVYVSISAKEDR